MLAKSPAHNVLHISVIHKLNLNRQNICGFCRQDDSINTLRQHEPGGGTSRASIRAEKLRDRKRHICNIIHNTTWLAESGTVLATIIFQLGLNTFDIDPYIINCLSDTISALIFWRIVDPYTHLFNEERIKIMVLEKGWLNAMQATLQFNIVNENQRNAWTAQNRSLTTNSNNTIKKEEKIHQMNFESNERTVENRVEIFHVEKNLTDNKNKMVVDAHMAFVTDLPNVVIDE